MLVYFRASAVHLHFKMIDRQDQPQCNENDFDTKASNAQTHSCDLFSWFFLHRFKFELGCIVLL